MNPSISPAQDKDNVTDKMTLARAIIIIILVLGFGAYFLKPQEVSIDIGAGANTDSSMWDVARSVALAPVEWGKAVKIEGKYDYTGTTPNFFMVDFTNDVQAIFQKDIDVVAYSKVKEKDKCSAYIKKFEVGGLMYDYSDYETCSIFETGIYNLTTNKSLVLEPLRPFGQDSLLRYGFLSYLDGAGEKITTPFSPKGRYFAQAIPLYEGCAIRFIDTTTGKPLYNQRTEGRYADAAFSCNPLLDFSEDEKTFTLRVVYGGMMGPGTQFIVVQNDKQWDILSELITEEFDFDTVEINPVDDFKITSITNYEVKFDIIKDTAYYKSGSYTFTRLDGKVRAD
jgi:hypothetical protein